MSLSEKIIAICLCWKKEIFLAWQKSLLSENTEKVVNLEMTILNVEIWDENTRVAAKKKSSQIRHLYYNIGRFLL